MKIFSLLLICHLFFFASVPDSVARDLIAVIKSREAEPYEIALRGFRRTLRDKGHDLAIEEWVLPEEGQIKDGRLAEVRKRNPRIFVALGSAATSQIMKIVKDTPVVFCMALNPVASGFVRSMAASGNNLTGASLDISPQLQFEALRTIVTSLKKIGVIYNPQETESVVQQAKKSAKEMGLELFNIPISSSERVPQALRSLDGTVDALWSVADSTTFSSGSLEFILLHTLRNKIPFMGLSPAFVKAGALMALAADYEDVGVQCGGLTARVLTGEHPSALPITTPQRVTLYVNLKTAETIELKIPADRLKGAVIIK